MSYNKLSVSKDDQFAQTPDWLLKTLKDTFGKHMFDPCPANPKFNGLKINWRAINFVNPPYDNIGAWLDKAVNEWKVRRSVSVFLIPFRMHTRYMERNLKYVTQSHIFEKSVKFKGYKSGLPTALHICVVGKTLSTFPKHVSVPCCKAQLVNPPNIDQLKIICKKIAQRIFVLHNSISEPLERIIKLQNKNAFCVICPARFDNKVLHEAFQKASGILFCCPTLKGDNGKFVEGTCALFFNIKRFAKEIQLKSLKLREE